MKMKEMSRSSYVFHVLSVTDKHNGDHYSYSKKLFHKYESALRFMKKQREKGVNCVAYGVYINVFGKIKLEYIGQNYEDRTF